MVTVLMVAEKPSIATSIAQALCKGKLEGRGKSPPIYEFDGTFLNKNVIIKVTSVTGHVFSVDFPPKYQHWDSVDPIDLFTAPIISISEKGGIVKHLERESKGADYLILWLDCDREGENICFEVIKCVEKSMNINLNGQKQNVYRAKFSAVTQKDIEKAMTCLVQPNLNESLAVETRQELDLKVGVAFSRFQTRYFQGKYGDLDSAVISYGPCQTPTLGFCVDRMDEIQTFSPEQFWTLDITIDTGNGLINLDWLRGRVFDQSIADMFLKMLQKETIFECTSIKVSESRRPRPKPMNTVELLKIASKHLGIGPHAAMKSAEHLYLSGFISYPRTESTSYPSSFDIKDTLRIQRSNSRYSEYVNNLLSNGYNSPSHGHDAGDHPPITPVGLGHGLSGDDARIFDLVVTHFLATISKDAIYENTKASYISRLTGEIFSATGQREIELGFMEIYGGSKEEDYSLPQNLIVGSTARIANLKLRNGQTSPPSNLTESELIELMEKNGIGTDASIPTHINNILVRNYVTLGSGRTLIPTALGTTLVHGYKRIDPALVLPDVRAAIETFCDLIAKGQATKESVLDHSLRNFENKFKYFTKNIDKMDSLFEASFSPLAATGKFLSKCGKCLRYMRYIPLKPQRLYCPTCNETYSLPPNGTVKLYKELKCPLDNFELVLFSLGNSIEAQGKSYPLCPYCYNHPPTFDEKEDVDKTDNDDNYVKSHMGCNSCTHPSCKHSATLNAMVDCPGVAADTGKQCSGQLILDVNSKPNWKLCCNQCNTLLRFHANIHNIIPQPRQNCDECGLRLATFEFHNLKTPLPDGETTRLGCIVCDDLLNSLTEIVVGRTMHIQVVRQQRAKRGRGRGRGRGGRGRGRLSKAELTWG